ncbi:MAG TPA: nitric-oxide reductase large subunit [Armatimonadota bacterium]|jgi:nitric oxide reductase subunit B
MGFRGLWAGLALVVLPSFAVLGYFGREVYQQAPPVPGRVLTPAGAVLFTGSDIVQGQSVWQAMGGQEVGTVWGHGAYVAPDWSADFLHREATFMLDSWARTEHGRPFSALDNPTQAYLKARLHDDIRMNTYDPRTGDVTVSPLRADAIAGVAADYTGLFGDAPGEAWLRNAYALPPNVVRNPVRMHQLVAFFFWASWACSTDRPGQEITYTNNWPPEPLIGNAPAPGLLVWSVIGFVALLAGIGALAWYFAGAERRHPEVAEVFPKADPLMGLHPTPSMRATLKYFWVVTLMLLVQIVLGVLTAHYGVEGSGFYGFPLARYLPYAVTRTWHLQLGLLWIATAWLATGLYMAPAVSGHEPRFQRVGVNVLFVCLLVIVVGSLAGEWAGVMHKLNLSTDFWWGHQGREYLDLGRFWQVFLLVGLFLWFALMARALWPALRNGGDDRQMLILFLLSSLAIPVFYAAGLAPGEHANLAVTEYWRWWVVHLWVEGFFEVFATVVIAFLFTRMGLLRTTMAAASILFATIIFLAGGIIGTLHHLYFTGMPTAAIAFGATFSALEIVPLTLIGFKGYQDLTLSRARPWVAAYRWPIYYFVAVAFWNLVGAGLLGFLVNPPIALYYMQGLNTTPAHSHAALFGVYGMLGIGLMLFCVKGLTRRRAWKTRTLAFSFWAINIGLALMVFVSLLPVGLLQTWASVSHGMWYARSAEFLQSPLMVRLRWMRIFGDTVFAVGALALAWFVAGLRTGWSLAPESDPVVEDLAGVPPNAVETVH